MTIYPPYTILPLAVTTLLSTSMSPFLFLLDPSTLSQNYQSALYLWVNLSFCLLVQFVH